MEENWAGERMEWDERNDFSHLDSDFVDGCCHNEHERLLRETKEVHFSWTNGEDEPSFEWIIELQDGRFATVSGAHDYTGWDCISNLYVEYIGNSVADCSRFLTADPLRMFGAM